MKEYKTRRGALLAELEHRCYRPGYWLVEGFIIEQVSPKCWCISEFTVQRATVNSFEAALEWVADHQGQVVDTSQPGC